MTRVEKGLRVGQFHALSDGNELHYHEAGRLSTGHPTVLFLHGSGPGASGYSNFKQNLQVVADSGYHVLVPDYLGYGLSSKPSGVKYTTDLQIAAIRELLAAKGVTNVVPVGNSLGGLIALQFALEYPEEVPKLILMGPAGVDDPATFVPDSQGFAKMARWRTGETRSKEAFKEILRYLVYDTEHVTEELVTERFSIALEQPDVRTANAPFFKDRLHELQMPILLFWGFRDDFLPFRLASIVMDKALNVKLVASNRVGHWYMLEAAADFNRECIAFLEE